jgi:hypothetical protein
MGAACRTWRPAGPAEPTPARVATAVAAASGQDADPVRVTTRGGGVVVLLRPRVEPDSVVGTDARERRRRAVALADVARVEAYRVGVVQTGAGVIAGVLVAGLAFFVFALTQLGRGT